MIGLMATEGALFVKKMEAAQRDTKLYRARMNAVVDAEAKRLGATITGAEPEGDGVQVFTNSPITNNPAPIIIQPPGWPAWAKAMVLIVAILAGTFLLWSVVQSHVPVPAPIPGPGPAPTPQPVPDGDLHIEVIPGPPVSKK